MRSASLQSQVDRLAIGSVMGFGHARLLFRRSGPTMQRATRAVLGYMLRVKQARSQLPEARMAFAAIRVYQASM
jgi:hypothetical protein